MSQNQIIIRGQSDIGAYSAENDDTFLFECFIKNSAFESVADLSSNQTILYGNTGRGKTAIIRYLKKTKRNTLSINLNEISLDYLVNSNVVRLLTDIEADTNALFQAFWRYIIILSYIQLKYKIGDKAKSKNWVDGWTHKIRTNQRRKKALAFLAEHRDNFWVTAETAVEEYAERLENEFKSSMGAAYDVFKMDAGYGRKQSSEKKKQLRRKLTSIINPELLKSLKDMMTLLSQDSNPDGRQFYLMIDSIDENWIDESVRYKLIRSLIETQKTFRTIPDLKIVIAMRADIFDRALAEASDPSIQRDKLNDYKAEISWTKAELLELVDSRVKELCSRKYTTKGVSFNDIFCTKIDQKTPFNYIVERTLMRPRDMILFVNDCLIQAKGKSTVTKTNIQRAEEKYSRDRKRAMIDEWKSCLPSVELCLNTLRTLPKHLGTYSDFSDSIDWTDLEVRLFEIGDKFGHDPLGKVVHAKGFTTSNLSMKNSLLRVLLSQLYRIGALGIKQSEGSPIQYVFNGPAFVDPDEVTDQLRWYIHKGLRNVLGFRTANDSGRN